MIRKTAWLIGALALILWAWPPGMASADHGRHGHGAKHHKYERHFGKHRSRHRHALEHHGFRHRARKHRTFPRYRFGGHGFGGHGFGGHEFGGHGFGGHGFGGHEFRHRGRAYPRHGAAFVVQPYFVAEALERASDGQAIVWHEPRRRGRYEVVPTRTTRAANGRYCREYLSTATVGGRTREVYGQACRQADGSWEIVR